MSRVQDKIRKRAKAVRDAFDHAADIARADAREVERERLANRLRELSEKLRVGDYPGRREDLAEIDRLWSLAARVTP